MSGWSLFPHLIVRCTGFPFDLLERFRYSGSADAARRLAWETGRFEQYRSTAPRLHRPSKPLLDLLKAHRPVPAELTESPDLFVDWNRYAETALAASIEFEQAFGEDERRTQAELEALLRSERFLEAVASSSPPVFADIRRGRLNARVHRQLASYLQRFTAKNETMSFFGPINYGRVEPAAAGDVSVSWSGPLTLRRHTFLASWLVQGIARRIAFLPDILPWLVFRRKGFSQAPTRGNRRGRLGDILIRMGVVHPDQVRDALARQTGTRARLGEILLEQGLITASALTAALAQQAQSASVEGGQSAEDFLPQLVGAADGTRNARGLAAALRVELPLVLEYVRIGCDRGLLTHQLEVPAGVHRPLEDLMGRLAGIPGPRAREQLGLLEEVLVLHRRYSEAGPDEKVKLNDQLRTLARAHWGVEHTATAAATKPSGDSPTPRGEGHNFYADRLPLREECGGDLRITVSGERAAELAAKCQRPLELMAHSAVATRLAARREVGRLMGKREIPLWRLLTAVADRPIPYDTSLSAAITAQLEDPSEPVYHLDRLSLPPLEPGAIPVAASVDLLIRAASVEAWQKGHYQVVMGDMHDTVLVWGWALQFHDQRAEVESQMMLELGKLPREIPVVTALASRRTGLVPAEFPGPVVEVGGVSGHASGWKMPLDDLVVRSDGELATLWSTNLDAEVCLYNGELESLVHTAFALPRLRAVKVQVRPHTPRLVLDGVVLQREQWLLSPESAQRLLACETDRERLQTGLALWDELGLPEYTFAKFKGERKPILVDVRNPLLMRVFVNLLGQRDEVWLSEMLPGPEELWLRHGEDRFTAELRCTFLRSGDVP
jgi:hypothetical protein